VLSDRSALILPAELTTRPLTINAICPFWMPAKITSVALFSIVRPKSLGSTSRMWRIARSYGILESWRNASAFARRSPWNWQALPQMERRRFLFVKTRHCGCTARFVNDLAPGKGSKLAVHATIGRDHHAVIRVID